VNVGYMRVSKSDGSQSLALQRDALLDAGVHPKLLFEDLASGRLDDRPGLTECLRELRNGDVLMVWKLDRLGRDLRHLISVVDDLRNRRVGFKVLTGQGAHIDTTTPNGRLVFAIFAAMAEFERALIGERTRAGLTAARARGRKGGRPRKMDGKAVQIAMTFMKDQSMTATEVARRLGISATTLYAHVNGDGSPKAKGAALLNAAST
jgi:DNA invertase Pin-like site-specific DNA recombinase